MGTRLDLKINGTRRQVVVEPGQSLLQTLRESFDLTGSKYGCGEGQCGACTVLIDGKPRRSCTTPASALAEASIVTIEGLAEDGKLHPLQQAFLEDDALQCGYCTPGMIMSAAGLLAEDPDPTEREIIAHMQGNICRCGTYPRIVRAIRRAAASQKGGGR